MYSLGLEAEELSESLGTSTPLPGRAWPWRGGQHAKGQDEGLQALPRPLHME